MRFRIIALPIARTRKPIASHLQPTDKPSYLVYYHFQSLTSKNIDQPSEQPNIFKRGINTALNAWSSMGKAPEGNWKHRIFTFGERMMDRIDFEETMLKNLKPPRPEPEQTTEVPKDPVVTIPLLYPKSLLDPNKLFGEFVAHRGPLHRRGFLTWLVIAPLTAPFAIVPVIPNLPFFFSAWRSWSHWRAWKSTEFLEDALKKNLVVPELNERLEGIYESATKQDEGTAEEVLLSPEQAKQVVSEFELDGGATIDLLKAIEQTRQRLKKVTH